MTSKIKFVSVTRVIDPKTGIHYLDAVDTEGQLWSAEMRTGVEKWIVYTSSWKKSGGIPYKDT
jgi:hypothetical protein